MAGYNEEQGDAHASPYFRVWTCGVFRMERRVRTEYEAVRTAEWGGSSYPRLLLKALLCCPGRQARREALIEMLWPDTDPDQAAHYLNTATTKLRKVLQPIKGQESLLLTEDDALVYRLEGQPLLWMDADEGVALLKQAEQRGRTGAETLPLLERAGALFNTGTFLQEEEGLWAAGRRALLDRTRYRCWIWLAETYSLQGMSGQAETVLSQLLEEDPLDEDVLYRLMGLLHRQGMTHQALRLYESACRVFTREGVEPTEAIKMLAKRFQEQRYHCALDPLIIDESSTPLPVPDPRPYDIREYVRTKQIQQKQPQSQSISQEKEPSALLVSSILQITSTTPPFNQQDAAHAFFSPPLTIQDIMETVGESEKENAQIMNPLRRATTIGILSLLGGKVLSPEWWERLAHPHPSAMNTEAFTYFQQLLEIGWGLSNTGELHAAEHVVMSFLPRIFQLAPHQKEAASIAAEGLRLRGILAAHQLRIADKLIFSLQAVEYARQASDPNILVAELTELAAAFEYAQQQENSFKTHQEALPLAEQASPLIRSRFYGRSAIAFAKKGRTKEALSYIDLAYDTLPEYPENEQNFLSSDHGSYKLARHKGLMYLSMGKLAEAEKSFESIRSSSTTVVPERSRLEIVNDKGRVAILLNDLTKYAEYLEEGIAGSLLLKSQKRFDEALTLYQREMPKAWQNERPIKQIVERFHIERVKRQDT